MNWKDIIEREMKEGYYDALLHFLVSENQKYQVFPPKKEVFNAFKMTPFDKVKVVIIGQDPYIKTNEAHGLAFSSKSSYRPPSLRNIFKELNDDIGVVAAPGSRLDSWAKQGVLLLNSALTVRAGEPNAHSKYWQPFTDRIIQEIDKNRDNIVYILWGAFARSKKTLLANDKKLVIESSHPSPLGAHVSFFGSKPFSKTNEFLVSKNIEPIDWKI